jgi:hypothetical protein
MQDSITSFKPIVREWESYCALADMKQANRQSPNKFNKRNRELWGEIDKSLPILIGNHTWYIRILHHKINGLYLDVRKFEHKTNGLTTWYEPTDEGMYLPISSWLRLFDPIFKLIKKWRDNK